LMLLQPICRVTEHRAGNRRLGHLPSCLARVGNGRRQPVRAGIPATDGPARSSILSVDCTVRAGPVACGFLSADVDNPDRRRACARHRPEQRLSRPVYRTESGSLFRFDAAELRSSFRSVLLAAW
jgi:hypothetical protein